jgi:pimeloyl-ACP methyl ester carboxylesterase
MATFVLVPGMWIGAWAWAGVTARLRAAGHEAHPLTLAGVAERRAAAGPDVDLDTHTDDVVRTIEDNDLRDVVLVGHSYGGMPVTAAAERIPARLSRVVFVDSGPLPDGARQLDQGQPAPAGVDVPPPAWDPAADPVNQKGLDAVAVRLLEERSTPHPYGSVAQPLRRTGPQELAVPVALIACVFDLDQVRTMRDEGHPWFTGLAHADLYSLPTGHWPMLSEPARLADLLAEIAAARAAAR